MDENKDNQHDSSQKAYEYLGKISQLIIDVQERINIAFRKGEESKLKGYKENLLKTKEKFENIHEERNEANITKNIFQYKKDLEK